MDAASLALSKGRIFDETQPLLARVGIRAEEAPERSRKLVIATNRPDLRLIIVRAADTPTYVQHGGVGAPDREPGRAQDQARPVAAAHRRLCQGGARMMLRRLSTRTAGFDAKLAALTRYEPGGDAAIRHTVQHILADVRGRGDAALIQYS